MKKKYQYLSPDYEEIVFFPENGFLTDSDDDDGMNEGGEI